MSRPRHSVAAVELVHQEAEDGRLGVRRQRVKRFGPQRVADVRLVAVTFQKDPEHFGDGAASQLGFNQLVAEDLY